eukprot:5853026-Amphidinium_carterae.1
MAQKSLLQFGVLSKKANVERRQASDAVHDELRHSHIERLQLSKPKKRKVGAPSFQASFEAALWKL